MSIDELDCIILDEINGMMKSLAGVGIHVPPGKITFDQADNDFREVTICFRYRKKDDGKD